MFSFWQAVCNKFYIFACLSFKMIPNPYPTVAVFQNIFKIFVIGFSNFCARFFCLEICKLLQSLALQCF